MKITRVWLLPMVAMSFGLTGCVDDNYDLSDIDTTVKVRVNDLIVPINLDEITLKNILDLDEDSKVKDVNGVYAFVEDGEFRSDVVKVNKVHVSSPDIAPTVATIRKPADAPSGTLMAGEELTFNVGGESTEYSVSTDNVPSSIVSVKHAECDYSLDVVMSLKGLEGMVGNVRMRNIVMQLPRGLEIAEDNGNYNPETGRVYVGDRVASGSKLTLHFTVTGFDFEKSGVTYDYPAHRMSFSDQLCLSEATLVLGAEDVKVPVSQLPETFELHTEFNMGSIQINSFSGRIKYDVNGVNVSDVLLTDLPDIFTQEGTDIRIANPQIYVNVHNPLNEYGLKAETGMEITSYKDDSRVGTYALDAPGKFEVEGVPGQTSYNYCLSPKAVEQAYPGYEGAKHVGYTSLSNVLSGNGLPTRLAIDFVNPCVPEQDVEDFRLGTELGNVGGTYTFFAPLAFGEGSTVVYSDVIDGWSSEDLDAVTVETLVVTATVSTNIPVSVEFTGSPIGCDGRVIDNVEIEGAQVAANANEQQVNIRVTGEFTGLDGITFTARAVAGADEKALTPNMNVVLKNVRSQVSGYYEKEL